MKHNKNNIIEWAKKALDSEIEIAKALGGKLTEKD